MDKVQIPQLLDKVFEALANKHRREIMHALSLQPHSISQLAQTRGLSLPAMHKHIKILKAAGLLQEKKIGRTRFLALKRTQLRTLQEWLMQFHAYWGNDKETLENYAQYLEKSERNHPSLKLRMAKGGEKK